MIQDNNVMRMFDLTGKVFLVAGGGRHLGWDMALALAEAGADGMITSRDAQKARQAADRLTRSTGRRVVGEGMDATDPASVAAAVDVCKQTYGRVDILVNNVGGGALARPDEASEFELRDFGDWERLIRLNLSAPWLVARHVAPLMQRQGSGSIIFIASIAGVIGRDRRMYGPSMKPQTIDYAAAKGGVIALARDLAAYLGPYQIRVNSISPGGFARGQPEAFINAYADRTMLRRMGRDGVDLKGAAVFLASDASAYVTGHNLVVDGGFSAWQ